MNKQEIKNEIKLALKQEKNNTKKILKELLEALPSNEENCLYWPSHKGWNQFIEDALLNAGYNIAYLSNSKKYYIELSNLTRKEIEKIREDDEFDDYVKKLDEEI